MALGIGKDETFSPAMLVASPTTAHDTRRLNNWVALVVCSLYVLCACSLMSRRRKTVPANTGVVRTVSGRIMSFESILPRGVNEDR
jgi:hypothetical protein